MHQHWDRTYMQHHRCRDNFVLDGIGRIRLFVFFLRMFLAFPVLARSRRAYAVP
jgi:hypothetical protein